jgi:Aminoglycoside-2''-adenylyltransferase
MGPTADRFQVEQQFEAIKALSNTLDRHGIDYWLFGGWAVDFWVGEITRAHDDIDVAAWRADYDLIKVALLDEGWQHTPVANEVVGTRYQWGTTQAEFTFVVADERGRVVIPFDDQPVLWSTRPFGTDRRELRGVTTRTIPLKLLKAGKEVAREGASEAEKDRADLDALSRVGEEE